MSRYWPGLSRRCIDYSPACCCEVLCVIKEGALAQLARLIDLGEFLRLGRGEKISKGHERDSTLCDAFEALIGAIYLDSNNDLTACEILVNSLTDKEFPEIRNLPDNENPKGALQEWSQERFSEIPEYKLLETSGPDHNKVFTVCVNMKQRQYGIGKAGKRQTAEEVAARAALEKIRSGEKQMQP